MTFALSMRPISLKNLFFHETAKYINKQGGTNSPQLCYQVWDLWNMAIQNNIQLKAAHIAGKLNILADQLSRDCVPMQINLSRVDPRFEKDSELLDCSKTILLVVFLSD
jgi:hypothetical protein